MSYGDAQIRRNLESIKKNHENIKLLTDNLIVLIKRVETLESEKRNENS